MPDHHILGQTASYYHWGKVDGIDAQGRLKVERADGKIFLFKCHHRKNHRSLTNHRSEPLRLFLLANPKFQMNGTFGNVYEHEEWARAYATLEFPGTYYLAFRDLPALIRRYDHGSRALDFGCGTGRSTRLLRNLGLNVIRADISQAMLDQAHALDPSGEYHLFRRNIAGEFAPGSFYIILAAVTLTICQPNEGGGVERAAHSFSSRSMPAPGCFFNRNLRQRMGVL